MYLNTEDSIKSFKKYSTLELQDNSLSSMDIHHPTRLNGLEVVTPSIRKHDFTSSY